MASESKRKPRTDWKEDLRKDMVAEVRDLLGSGFVSAYYEQMAEGFAIIAEHYAKKRRRSR